MPNIYLMILSEAPEAMTFRGFFHLEELLCEHLKQTQQPLPIPQPESHLSVPFISKQLQPCKLQPSIELSVPQGLNWWGTTGWPWLSFTEESVTELGDSPWAKAWQDKNKDTAPSVTGEMVIVRSSRTQKKNTDMKKYKTPRKKKTRQKRATQQDCGSVYSKRHQRPTLPLLTDDCSISRDSSGASSAVMSILMFSPAAHLS